MRGDFAAVLKSIQRGTWPRPSAGPYPERPRGHPGSASFATLCGASRVKSSGAPMMIHIDEALSERIKLHSRPRDGCAASSPVSPVSRWTPHALLLRGIGRAKAVGSLRSRTQCMAGSSATLTPSSPATWRSHSKGAPNASSAARVASTISGPIPSPGMRVTGMGRGIVLIRCR